MLLTSSILMPIDDASKLQNILSRNEGRMHLPWIHHYITLLI
jgi:hypothetical protein